MIDANSHHERSSSHEILLVFLPGYDYLGDRALDVYSCVLPFLSDV